VNFLQAALRSSAAKRSRAAELARRSAQKPRPVAGEFHFFPPALSIVYGFFLLTVFVYQSNNLRVKLGKRCPRVVITDSRAVPSRV